MEDTLINCAAKLKIAVIGDIMLDVYVDGTVERLSPEAPNCIVLDEYSRSYTLGGAGNVALNLARFGVETRLCGIVGSTNYIDATRLSAMIQQRSNETRPGGLTLVEIQSPRCPTVKTRFRSEGQQQLLRVDHEDRQPLACDRAVEHAIEQAVDGVDAVIISDYAKGVISDSMLLYLLGRLGDRIPYFVDPKRPNLNDYARCGSARPVAICPNHKEWTSSREYRDGVPIDAANVIVTHGRTGCYIVEIDALINHWCNRYIKLQREVEVADPSGAGDTFIATLAVALMSGSPVEEACRVANCAASCVVSDYGVVTPSIREVQGLIDQELKVVGESARPAR